MSETLASILQGDRRECSRQQRLPRDEQSYCPVLCKDHIYRFTLSGEGPGPTCRQYQQLSHPIIVGKKATPPLTETSIKT